MNGLTNFCWYDHLPKSLSLPVPRGRFENIPRSLKRFLSGRSSGFTSSKGAPSAGSKQAAWNFHSWLPILTVTWPLLSTARTRPTFPQAFQWKDVRCQRWMEPKELTALLTKQSCKVTIKQPHTIIFIKRLPFASIYLSDFTLSIFSLHPRLLFRNVTCWTSRLTRTTSPSMKDVICDDRW